MKINPNSLIFFTLISASVIAGRWYLARLNHYSPRPSDIYLTTEKAPIEPPPFGDEFIPELDLPLTEKEERESRKKLDPEIHIKVYGSNDFSFKYGESFYISEIDRLAAEIPATTPAFPNGFLPSMDLKLNAKGNVGNNVNMKANFDQKEILGNNEFFVSYEPESKISLLKELKAGNMDFDFGDSRLVTFRKDTYKALGLQTAFELGNFKLKVIGAVSESQKEVELFEGGKRHRIVQIPEYRFLQRQFYQLEPFLFYDNMTSKPSSITQENYSRGSPASLNTLASDKTLTPALVNIDPGSVEIYIDSGLSIKNSQNQATPFYINGSHTGNFYRMKENKDFFIQYAKGRIKFTQPLPVISRVLVRYTRNGSSVQTSDPSARINGGKIETFIKYGISLNEDSRKDGVVSFTGVDDIEIIRDGVVNLDIYEVRGIYDLQGMDIDQGSFKLSLAAADFKTLDDIESLDYYSINYQDGILEFAHREPFKRIILNGNYLLTDSDIRAVYSESQGNFIYQNSKVLIKSDYFSRLRSFQLKHTNIVPASEEVRVNGNLLDKNQYFLDYQSGYFLFTNIPLTMLNNLGRIQVSYNYIPFGATRQNFLVGSRLEYRPLQEFQLGWAAYYNGDFHPEGMDYVGKEPGGLFITEVDANLKLNEKSTTQMVNKILNEKYAEVPVKFSAFGEFAYSVYDHNTMGKALIDNMETSQDTMDANLYANNWILSSIPPSTVFNQCNRSPLYFKYYYDPENFDQGLMSYTSNPSAAPPYTALAGPYNVVRGHLSAQQLAALNNQKQISMVMDFNFALAPDNSNPFAGIQSKISSTPVDFSGFTQVEFYAYLENDSMMDSGVELFIDIGSQGEDTDGNNLLGTEDIGLDHIDGDTNSNGIQDSLENWDTGERNHVLDYNRGSGESEDIGYPFNPPGCSGSATIVGGGPAISGYPATVGNGILNSEDLNDNGQLDLLDNVVTISPGNPGITFENSSNIVLPGAWRRFKAHINLSLLGENEKETLKKIEGIRIYAVPVGAAKSGKGRLYIDQIHFAGSQWRNKKEKLSNSSETILTDPSILRVTNIDNFNTKDEYDSESFILKKRDEYEALYGRKSNFEIYTIKEGALKMEYNLPIDREYVFVEKIFREPLNLSFYKKLNVWLNHREYSNTGGKIFFRAGTDENNYYEFVAPVNQKDWQKLDFDLSSPDSKTGYPNPRHTKYMAVGIKNSAVPVVLSGISWINDIYVSETIIKSDYAYTYGATVEVTKPLLKTKSGIPVFSDFKTSYYKKFKNSEYRSIGETNNAQLEDEDNLQVQSKIFPFWESEYSLHSYISENLDNYESISGNYEGNYSHVLHRTRQEFLKNINHAPHIGLGFSYSNDNLLQPDTLYGTENDRWINTSTKKYLPEFYITQETPMYNNFFQLKYNLKAAVTYLDREKFEDVSYNKPYETNEQFGNKEQWESSLGTVEFIFGKFNLKAVHDHNQQMMVQQNYSSNTISSSLPGTYSIPFFDQPSDFRFEQRNNGLNLETGFSKLWKISPKISFEFRYNEDSFKDLPFDTADLDYQRIKNSSSLTGLNFTIPLIMSENDENKKTENPKNNLNRLSPREFPKKELSGAVVFLNFKRELKLTESNVPFLAQSSLETDSWGISRVFPEMMNHTFNLIDFPFWYYFLSPGANGSFFNAREYIGSENFGLSEGDNGLFPYDNTYSLREIISLNSRLPANSGLTIVNETILGQETSRSSMYSGVLHQGNFGYYIQFVFNLMKMLNTGFWSNKENNSSVSLGFRHDINMFFVSNVVENQLKPDLAFEFKWSDPKYKILNGITFKIGAGIRSFEEHQYLNESEMDSQLQTEVAPIEYLYTIQKLINFNVSIELFTEVPKLKLAMESMLHSKLEHNPKYSINLLANINRYDVSYFNIIQPGVLDEYIMRHSLDINLHRNVTGIFDIAFVYDIRRNPDDNHIIQEIFSLQAGISAKILF